MPDSTINRTAAGWPYLDQNNFIDVIDNYTVELATKLENGEADVAAAINAAKTANDLIRTWGPATVGAGITLGTGWNDTAGYNIRVTRVGKTVFCSGLATISAGASTTVLTLPSWATPRYVGRASATAANKATGLIGLEPNGTLSYQSVWWTATPTGWVNLPPVWEAAS